MFLALLLPFVLLGLPLLLLGPAASPVRGSPAPADALTWVSLEQPDAGVAGGRERSYAGTPGRFGWPVSPPVVARRFDPPPRPWLAGHRGVDLAATPGAVVRAAGPGRVTYAGVVAGRGVISVAHAGGLRTTYEPVTAGVAVGDDVTGGGELGRLTPGHPGCAARACLHWGLRRGEFYLDPLALLGLGRVRLLPLEQSP